MHFMFDACLRLEHFERSILGLACIIATFTGIDQLERFK